MTTTERLTHSISAGRQAVRMLAFTGLSIISLMLAGCGGDSGGAWQRDQ